MSTKTSIKRIALVAVSALGFGLLSVVPAKAAEVTVSAVTANATATVGVPTNAITLTTLSGTATASGPDTIRVSTLTGPVGGSLTIKIGLNPTQTFLVGASNQDYLVNTANVANASTVTVTANLPGKYTINWKGASGAVPTVLSVGNAQTSTLQAQLLSDPTNGTIFLTNADDPIIVVTRGTGVAGDAKLRVDASPDLAAGTVIKSTGGSSTVIAAANTLATAFTLDSASSGSFDAQGTYSFTAWTDSNGNDLVDAAEQSATTSFVISGTPSTSSVSLDRTSILDTATTVTATVTLVDAGGRPSYGNVTLTPSSTTAGAADLVTMSGSAGAGLVSGNGSRIGTSNQYTITATYASGAAGPGSTITLTSSVGTTRTAAFSVSTSLTAAITRLELASATGIYTGTVGASSYTTVIPADTTNGTDVEVTADPAVTTFTFTLTGTAARTYAVTTILGANTAASRVSVPATVTTLADGKATFTATVTTPVAATATSAIRDSFTVRVTDTTDTDAIAGGLQPTVLGYAVTYAAPTALWTLSPAATSNARVLEKSSNTVTAKLTDVYGRTLANRAYTVSVAGRNVSASAGVTDANGVATYTVNDTDTRAYSTTLGTASDTVTFSHTDPSGNYAAVTGAVTFTYVTALTVVGSVAVTVNTADATVDQTEALPGAPAGSAIKEYTATVRTATGVAAGAGILVTFSGGADDIFVDGIKTGVTNSLGQAAVSVYRQKTGFSNISATANGVSGSALSVRWVNDGDVITADGSGTAAGSDARNVSVTATQSTVAGSAATVVARVTDRWGNPVSGVLVTWSLSGVGRAVTGADLTVGTDSNGSAQIQVTSLNSETGDMTVTATIAATGQTVNRAGFVGTTAVAGVTAGNFTSSGKVTFTKNTETSTADALLELAKAQTAAAEATKAAEAARKADAEAAAAAAKAAQEAAAAAAKATADANAAALLELAKAIGAGKEATAAEDAALEAIDAANAATDAANLAAEAADAATVAAEEARDAADAATAAVEALSAEVSTLVAALKAQITTLANTVAKIAKKVKA